MIPKYQGKRIKKRKKVKSNFNFYALTFIIFMLAISIITITINYVIVKRAISSTNSELSATEVHFSAPPTDVIEVFVDTSIDASIEAKEVVETPVIYFPVSEVDKKTILCIVAGESKGEPLEGQMAVAQCLLNAMKKENMSAEQIRREYQYSGWDPHPENYPTIREAVEAVFDRGEKVTEEEILWFYAPKWCNSPWHESQKFVMEIGGHRFFAPLS